MQINNLNLGASGKPFPHARPSQALREEDAFMQLHGGTGSRSIFAGVSRIASGGALARRWSIQLAHVIANTAKNGSKNFKLSKNARAR
ncbi:MAG: hypothetical protein V7703_10155 [Hyphomicrobiales bacterium]